MRFGPAHRRSVRHAITDRARMTVGRVGRIQSGPGAGLWFTKHGTPGYLAGTNERAVQEALAAHVRPGTVMYDVGANVGFFTIIGSRLVGPAGSVYAFEPLPANVSVVREHCRLNAVSNVTILQLALADRDARAKILVARHAGGAVLSGFEPPPDLVGTQEVETATIDRLVSTGSVPPPDVVKIDVEGAELAVLAGMKETRRRRPPVILVELDAPDPAALSPKIRALEEFATQAAYDLDRLPDSYAGMAWAVAHFVCTPVARTPVAPGAVPFS